MPTITNKKNNYHHVTDKMILLIVRISGMIHI